MAIQLHTFLTTTTYSKLRDSAALSTVSTEGSLCGYPSRSDRFWGTKNCFFLLSLTEPQFLLVSPWSNSQIKVRITNLVIRYNVCREASIKNFVISCRTFIISVSYQKRRVSLHMLYITLPWDLYPSDTWLHVHNEQLLFYFSYKRARCSTLHVSRSVIIFFIAKINTALMSLMMGRSLSTLTSKLHCIHKILGIPSPSP